MSMRTITCLAVAAGLGLSLSACQKKPEVHACGTSSPVPCDVTTAGASHTDVPPGAEQQK